jgi:hypothetical protein
MEKVIENEAQRQRQKKFLLVLPLLALPFMALFFWAFGGGKGDNEALAAAQKGINTELPSAQFKGEKPQDKLSLYDQAAKDSANTNRKAANPLFSNTGNGTASTTSSAEASAMRLNQKLAELNHEISQPPPPSRFSGSQTDAASNPDIDRLEKLLRQKQQATKPDPEMEQLNGMLEKIQQIQHPELVQAQLKKETKTQPDSLFKAIPALIDGSQKVLQGGIVRLRLVDSIILNGTHLPKGFKLFGNCVITNQRLLLTIKNVTLGNTIVPVDLTVFSRDGIPGINAPEAELSEAAGNGTNDALSGMEFLPMSETLGTQAASAGINAAKGLIGKKVRKIKVKLQNNYPVLLRNNH